MLHFVVDSQINSSARTVVLDSSCTQSIAIVGVSAMKTLLKLFATLKLYKANNNKPRKSMKIKIYLSSVSSTTNFTLSLESSVIDTCGWLAKGMINVFKNTQKDILSKLKPKLSWWLLKQAVDTRFNCWTLSFRFPNCFSNLPFVH